MARIDPQVNFRIPAELKQAIEDAAVENNRSISAQLVSLLDDALKPTVDKVLDGGNVVELKRTIQMLMKAVESMQGIIEGQAKALKVNQESLERVMGQVQESNNLQRRLLALLEAEQPATKVGAPSKAKPKQTA